MPKPQFISPKTPPPQSFIHQGSVLTVPSAYHYMTMFFNAASAKGRQRLLLFRQIPQRYLVADWPGFTGTHARCAGIHLPFTHWPGISSHSPGGCS